MTNMYRHVRVSVRPLAQSTNTTWGTPGQTFAHARYQRLQALAPLDGRAILALQREGFYADWTATAMRTPEIPDGARLVTFDQNGTRDLVFHVAKILPRGRRVTLMLQEIREEQS